LIEAAGGLHRFMGWEGVLATDSGGFQVFSLRHGQVADELKGRRRLPPAEGDPIDAVRVDEEGADFRSYLDGRRHRFTPENNMALQRSLGADLLFCLDECTPFHVPPEYTRAATERNARWARRCLEAFDSLQSGETILIAIRTGKLDDRKLHSFCLIDLGSIRIKFSGFRNLQSPDSRADRGIARAIVTR
jgi:queuine tRNA-ribosyltransferase